MTQQKHWQVEQNHRIAVRGEQDTHFACRISGCPSFPSVKRSLLVIGLIWLVKEEVRSQLFVLVTREIGLDDKIALEAETAQLGRVSEVYVYGRTEIEMHTRSMASLSSSVTFTV